jgi:hypothetical protein
MDPNQITREFTLDERTEISQAFDAGNYAQAYESENLEDHDLDGMSEHERAAFVLGFFGSRTLDEMGSDREIFDKCYWSAAGYYVVKIAKYTGCRAEEYADEAAAGEEDDS